MSVKEKAKNDGTNKKSAVLKNRDDEISDGIICDNVRRFRKLLIITQITFFPLFNLTT